MFEPFKKNNKEARAEYNDIQCVLNTPPIELFHSPQANLMYQELCFRFIDEKPDDLDTLNVFAWLELVKDIRKIDDDIVFKMETADNASDAMRPTIDPDKERHAKRILEHAGIVSASEPEQKREPFKGSDKDSYDHGRV